MGPLSTRPRLVAALVALAAAAPATASAAPPPPPDAHPGFWESVDLVEPSATRSCVGTTPCTGTSAPWAEIGFDERADRGVAAFDGFRLPGVLASFTITRAVLAVQVDAPRVALSDGTTGAPPDAVGLRGGGVLDPAAATGPFGVVRPATTGGTGEGPAPGTIFVDVTDEVRAWAANAADPTTGRPASSLAVTTAARLEASARLGLRVATTTAADPDARPLLYVSSVAPAQAGTRLTFADRDATVGRFAPLAVHDASANATRVRFEYRFGDQEDWRPVPREALRFKADGTTPASDVLPVADGTSTAVTWDLLASPGAHDGPVDVRAFVGTGDAVGGGVTETSRAVLRTAPAPDGGSTTPDGEQTTPDGGQTTPGDGSPASGGAPGTGPVPAASGTTSGGPAPSGGPGSGSVLPASPPAGGATTPAGTSVPLGGRTSPALRLRPSAGRVTRSGSTSVLVRCPRSASAGCAGRLRAELRGGAVAGSARYAVAPGTAVRVPLRLGARARRLVRAAPRGGLVLRLRATPAGGRPGPAVAFRVRPR